MDASITFLIPLGQKNLLLEIQEVIIEYQLITSSDQNVRPCKENRHYQGIVKDDPNSLVALTFGKDEIIGMVAMDEGNFNLIFDRELGKYVFYNEKNVGIYLNLGFGPQPGNVIRNRYATIDRSHTYGMRLVVT